MSGHETESEAWCAEMERVRKTESEAGCAEWRECVELKLRLGMQNGECVELKVRLGVHKWKECV